MYIGRQNVHDFSELSQLARENKTSVKRDTANYEDSESSSPAVRRLRVRLE